MNLKNAVLSLLDIFRLNKGQKIAEEPAKSLAPLIQRLSLPQMPADKKSIADRQDFVFGVIRTVDSGKFAEKISKRVLGKITRYYGVNLKGCDLFLAMPGRSNMLLVQNSLID